MKKRNLALFLALVLALSSILTACGGDDKKENGKTSEKKEETKLEVDEKGNIVELPVTVGPEPDTMDPTLNSASDVSTVLNHAFEGLMKLDTDGLSYIGGQAKDYKVSDDNLTYTFTLRDGLKWSDGSPLTAEDFVYSWNRAINPDTAADYEYLFQCIEGYDSEDKKLNVTAKDDKTLVVKLNAVTPYFIELCAFPAFFPVQKAVVEDAGESWSTDASTYIGNGPYKMTEWTHKSYMLFEKNENYYDVDKLGPNKIRFVLIEDPSAKLAAYQSGEVIYSDNLPVDEMDKMREKGDLVTPPQLGTYYVSYNTTNEFLQNPLVRKALTLAIDRQYLCKEIGKSGQVPAGAFVSEGLTDADISKQFREVGGEYFDPTANEENLNEAKKALKEAGYEDGKGLPVFEYIYNEDDTHKLVAQALQDMWSKIGVRIELISQEWATFLVTRKNGDYDIARNGWVSDYNDPISYLDMWITDGGNNDAKWSNSDYDKLIKDIKKSSNQEERMQLMHKAEDIIFDEWMLCPIWYYVDKYLLKSDVKGFYYSPLGYKFFQYVTIGDEDKE